MAANSALYGGGEALQHSGHAPISDVTPGVFKQQQVDVVVVLVLAESVQHLFHLDSATISHVTC